MTSTDPQLSDAARAVLRALLTARADCPDRAMTDAAIARAAQVPQRHVIALRGELIEYGYLVCATCGTPPGSFIDPVTGPLAESRRYFNSLTNRAREVFQRRRHFKRALESAELSRCPAASDGQMNLPLAPVTDPRKFCA